MRFILEQTGMRVIPALISFILLIIFIAPFFAGIINLGNCAGTFFSLILTAFFILNKQSTALLEAIWNKAPGKIILSIFSFFMIVCIIASVIMSVFMIRAVNDTPDGNETTLVILGCKVKGTNPSLMLKRRLDSAYDYLSENNNVSVIVSGGKGNDEQISEAQCMSEYLIGRGIAPERIIMEDKSSSTYENLRNSKKIIEENNLNKKITIVTDGYHQLRAEMIAENLGIDAYNISAHTSEWLIPTYWVREWFAIAYICVFG